MKQRLVQKPISIILFKITSQLKKNKFLNFKQIPFTKQILKSIKNNDKKISRVYSKI